MDISIENQLFFKFLSLRNLGLTNNQTGISAGCSFTDICFQKNKIIRFRLFKYVNLVKMDKFKSVEVGGVVVHISRD